MTVISQQIMKHIKSTILSCMVIYHFVDWIPVFKTHANSEDPYQIPHIAASILGLGCLFTGLSMQI